MQEEPLPTTSSSAKPPDAILQTLLESALAKDFDVIRPLGRGGMGCVYLAKERALDRFVAIKVLRPDLAAAEDHRERFRREARIVAQLSHPGILGLHSFGEIDNLWYFVMAYVPGESLAERIRREGAFAWGEAHRIMLEMAIALEWAHRHGVVHRDIKPANILLDGESGRAILADFGISKMSGIGEALTASGAILGTPDYMSPEQVNGESVADERSDIYSFGGVAYLMLTGHGAFEGEGIGGAMYRRLVQDPAPLNSLVRSIPSDLSAIVIRCLARNKADRWENATSLREALENILEADKLPEAVRDFRSFGPYAFLWAGGIAMFALLTDRTLSERVLLALLALLAPIGLVLHMWSASRKGMRVAALAKASMSPPVWWSVWWPRGLRRPSDLWDRLPFVARLVRITIAGSLPALFMMILLRDRMTERGGQSIWIDVGQWTVFGVVALTLVSGFVWSRRHGLNVEQAMTLLVGPTVSSRRWKDPELRLVLESVSGNVREPREDAPSDYLRAIREVLTLSDPARLQAASEVAAAAEGVLRAIDEKDLELAKLAADAGPEEANRLAVQLGALEVNGESNTVERSELRELVRTQLDVVRRMQIRHDVVSAERAHLMDLMRSLWKVVRTAGDSRPEGVDTSSRLASLCADIRDELAASLHHAPR